MKRRILLGIVASLLITGCSGDSAFTTEAGAVTTAAPTTSQQTTTTTSPQTTTTTPATVSEGAASTIFHGGPVITMDPDFGVAEAIAFDGDVILAVGTEAEVLALAGPETVIIDLEGRTVLPGLVDAHAHWIGDRHLLEIGDAGAAAYNAAANGWTSISELFVNQERLDELVALDEAGQLPVRVNAYLPVNYHEQMFGIWFGDYQPGQVLSPHVRVAGAKAFIDLIAPDRIWLTQEHSNQPGYYGDFSWTQEELNSIVAELHNGGWQIAIHTGGDAAHDMVLNAFEAALAGEPNELRHRIEHVALIRDDQIERMRDLGIVASIQLTWFQSDWMDDEFWGLYEENLGPERVAWGGRWRDLLDSGVPTIGGTDTPWTPAVSLGGLAEAVTRVGQEGTPPTDWMLAQRISVEEALRLITADAAYGTFEEDIKGTLTPGKLADLVVVSANPLEIPPEQLLDLQVLATVVGGETVYCDPAGARFCP